MEGFSVVMSIIHEQIIKDPAFKNFVLDCEILASNPEGLDSRSLFKKTQKIVKRKGEKDPNSIDLRCFDYIPLNDFKNGLSEKPCVTRKYTAERTVNFINLPFVNYVDILYRGRFDEEINNALYKEAISKRDEGIIIQVADSPYECKRTFTMIKMKAAESCDIRCIGVYEGLKERTKGTLGGIHVDYKGYTSTDVGGGFSQEERKLYWEHPELIVGKIVQVDFMQETITDNGELTMRQPEFRCIREEKTEPSYN
jgi:DNA ligase-1